MLHPPGTPPWSIIPEGRVPRVRHACPAELRTRGARPSGDWPGAAMDGRILDHTLESVIGTGTVQPRSGGTSSTSPSRLPSGVSDSRSSPLRDWPGAAMDGRILDHTLESVIVTGTVQTRSGGTSSTSPPRLPSGASDSRSSLLRGFAGGSRGRTNPLSHFGKCDRDGDCSTPFRRDEFHESATPAQRSFGIAELAPPGIGPPRLAPPDDGSRGQCQDGPYTHDAPAGCSTGRNLERRAFLPRRSRRVLTPCRAPARHRSCHG